MNQEDPQIAQKRQKALERLRANRGKNRVVNKTKQEAKADTVKSLIKGYRESYRSHKEQLPKTENLPETETQVAPEQLPKIAKAARNLQEKEQKNAEAVERLKEARKRLKQVRKAQQIEQNTPKTEAEEQLPPEVELPKRQQLRQDLLTADFFKSASQWLSSINPEPHLSSSSLEEVEFLYKEAKYRYKALKIMLEDTQRELDSFEVYLRMAKRTSDSESAN